MPPRRSTGAGGKLWWEGPSESHRQGTRRIRQPRRGVGGLLREHNIIHSPRIASAAETNPAPNGVSVWTIVLRRLPDAMSPALRSTVAWSLADAIEMPSSRASCDVGRSATRGGENGGPGAPHQRLQRAAASPGGCDVNRGGVDQVELAARRVEDRRHGLEVRRHEPETLAAQAENA